jgi:uncharacterized membrane protein YczE
MVVDVVIWWATVLLGLVGLLALGVFFEIAHNVRMGRREAAMYAAAQLKTLEDIRQLAWHAQNPEVRS